ncbi:cytochrome P450 [Aspergillus egyptiacus]|nr:cytochrome P450 [Aspergillus egyptiacus]
MSSTTYGLAALALWVVGQCVYNVFFHPLRAIPGPMLAGVSRWWLFWLEWKGNPHVEILELHRKYGRIVRIAPNEVSFRDLEASDALYGPTSKFEKSNYFYRAFEDQASNLFTMRDRQRHSQDKRLISHAFSRANILQHQATVFGKAATLMGRVAERAEQGAAIPLFPAFRCLTLDMISEFAFGRSIRALEAEDFNCEVLDAIDKTTQSVPFFQHFPLLRNLLRWASYYNVTAIPNGFLELGKAAEAGLEQMHSHDTWTMFKNMISSAEKKSIQLGKEHMIAEGIVMIVAGTDTTAASLAVTLHHLSQQPELYRRLQAEVRTVIPTLDSQPAFSDLDSLPFLDACVKEGLRISCPSRTRLPRTTTASMSPLYFLQDETIFPFPTSYNPARWLVEDEQRRIMLSYFHPFSRGTRQCIGQNLSIIEQKIVLSMFARRFNPEQVLKKDIKTREAITVRMDDPLDVRMSQAAD